MRGIKSLYDLIDHSRFEVNNTSSNKGLPKPLKMARIVLLYSAITKEVSKF